MKKLFLLLLLTPIISIAQNIKGTVVSQKDLLQIEDVNIAALNFNVTTLTNKNGEFTLKLPSNFKTKDSIEFSHVGFTTLKISLEDLNKINYKVVLSDQIENLSELTINANARLKLKSKLAFNKLSSLKNPISSFGSCIKDDKIYIVGGCDSYESNALDALKAKNINSEDPRFLQKYLDELAAQYSSTFYKGDLLIYDIKKDSWTTSKSKFKKRAFNNLNYYDHKFYVLGGKKVSKNGRFQYLENEIEVFDIDKQTITIDKTYPHQASNAASFSYKDNIIVLGGSIKATEKGQKEFTNKVHLYNITSGYWYQLTDMPIAKETSGVILDDKIYLIGGNNGKSLLDIESFDLTTEKWQTEGELFSGYENPTVTSNKDFIYFFEDRKMCIYDTKSKQLKEYLVELSVKSSTMYFFDNKLYIIGGSTFINYATAATANVYSINTDEFDTTKPNRIKVLSRGLNLAKNTN
ncbi:Kelch motif-containing protein [Flavobacterium aquidurense]|uniref:Galactose oxidase n=1 Tax=Flavobacterium frigidimaris TaxID=262320 RepID=A0ABX4BMM5_FLAFR|nr:carboxypeptidase-like regulatory domain-containing protein [Flavobacterium frigidimaris]OXA77058.1 galactose oxidase [Flavobacterium frigidimaris]SDZ24513.1 Kelch motif-containing protein [Flavobacterium aquidurense]